MPNFFNKYPYTDFHELNLDWILTEIKSLMEKMSEFIALNEITYADPLQWSIDQSYVKNTIVVDEATGKAYLSLQPVPAGVNIDNTAYWTVILDIASFEYFVTPQQFGAKADGITDDTDAIQSAIDFVTRINEEDPYARETGLGAYIVMLPYGRYKITHSLLIKSHGLTIRGSGRHASIIYNEIETGNKAAIANASSGYKQRVLLGDFAISLGDDTDRIGVDFTAIGQSYIERVAVYGYKINDRRGTGFILNAPGTTAGHLNLMINCIGQHLNTSLKIIGNTNANTIYMCEFHQNITGILLDGGGQMNRIDSCRLENLTDAIIDKMSRTFMSANYIDNCTNGIVIDTNGTVPISVFNHFAASVTNPIVNNYPGNRSYNLLSITNNRISTEHFTFSDGDDFYGPADRTYTTFTGELRHVGKTLLQETACSDILNFSTSIADPTKRVTIYRDSNNDLCFIDKTGTKKVFAFV